MGPSAVGNKSRNRSCSRNRMRTKRARRTPKGRIGPIVGEIAHPELATPGVIKKRRQNPRSNVTISGKKKQKILKQLRHMNREKSQMQIEEVVQPIRKKNEPKDIEMTTVKQKKPKNKKAVKKNAMDTD